MLSCTLSSLINVALWNFSDEAASLTCFVSTATNRSERLTASFDLSRAVELRLDDLRLQRVQLLVLPV